MSTPRGDVDAAVAGLQARWGAAAPRVVGALALAPTPVEAPGRRSHATSPLPGDDRVIHTGFAALDAILGPGRPPEVGQRRDPRRRLQRPDDARPPGRRGSPGAGLGRGLARPVAQLRPGRGRRPRHPARMARGHHPDQPGRGALDRGQPAGRAVGRPARPRPARRSTGQDRQTGQDRRPAPSTRRARPSRGDAAAHPRCARTRRRPGDRGRPVDRHPARAGPPVVGPTGPRRRRPAHRGARRPQPPRPAGASGDPPDPLRRGRRAGRLPRPRRPPDRRPRRPPIHNPHEAPDRKTHDHATPPPLRAAPAPRPGAGPTLRALPDRPARAGRPAVGSGAGHRRRPDARALGVRRGMPLGSAHRLVPEATFIEPDPDADRAAAEAAFEALGAFSPSLAGSGDPGERRVRAVRDGDRWPRAVVGARAGARRACQLRRCVAPSPGSCRGASRGRRHALRGDHRRDPRPAGSPVVVPSGDEAAFLATVPVRPPDDGPRRPRSTDPVRAAPRSGPWRSCRGRRSSPGSARRARGSTPGRVARRPSRSGRATPRSDWPSPCPSSRRSRISSRCGSCSTGSSPRSPPSSLPGDSPRTART